MKKTLLIASLALAAASASASAPQVINGFNLQSISPDGRYYVSEAYGNILIQDNTTGMLYEYYGDGMDIDYSIGNGNAWSDNGIMVGCTSINGGGNYWFDGEWRTIEATQAYEQAYTNGISAQGTLIAGSVSNLANEWGYDGTMLIPAVWEDLDGDKVFEKETLLPRPEFDHFGARPQYITACLVTPQGDTVIGQIVDNRGAFIYPILWKKSEQGEWEYSYPGIELFNPGNIEIVPNPGDGPAYVSAESFMTQEELDAYAAACDAWSAAGDFNVPYPEYTDFMSEEEKQAYQAAMEAWQAAYAAWEAAFAAYDDAYFGIIAASPKCVFNSNMISPSGKLFVQVGESDGDFFNPGDNYSIVYNLENGEVKLFPVTQNVAATAITDDGSMLGTNYLNMMSATMPSFAYIYKPGFEDFVPLYDYYKTNDPQTAAWMEENMSRDIETVDADWNPITLPGVVVTGTPFCNKDMSVIGCGVVSIFFTDYFDYNSYILSSGESSINDVAADLAGKLSIKASMGGVITLSGEAQSLAVYDLSGREVYSTKAPASVISTGLASGVYVVKATAADGKPAIAKIVF